MRYPEASRNWILPRLAHPGSLAVKVAEGIRLIPVVRLDGPVLDGRAGQQLAARGPDSRRSRRGWCATTGPSCWSPTSGGWRSASCMTAG